MRKLEGCDKVMYSSNAIIALGVDAMSRSVEEFTVPAFMTLHQEGREYLTRAPVDNEIFELREQCSDLTVEISRLRSECFENMNKLHKEKQKTFRLQQDHDSAIQDLNKEKKRTLNLREGLMQAEHTIYLKEQKEIAQSAEILQLQKKIAELENQVKRAPKPTIVHGPGSPHTIKRSRAEKQEYKNDQTFKLPRNHIDNSTQSTDKNLGNRNLPITYWVTCY